MIELHYADCIMPDGFIVKTSYTVTTTQAKQADPMAEARRVARKYERYHQFSREDKCARCGVSRVEHAYKPRNHGKHRAFPSRHLIDFYEISVRQCDLCGRRYWVEHPRTWRH